MAHQSVLGLLSWLLVLAPALTKPGASNALVVACGWILTRGRHAVTQALVETRIAGLVHHERFHRFFSRGSWSPDELARLVFFQIIEHLCDPDEPIDLVIDDTLSKHRGPKIFALDSHLDAVRSTKNKRLFAFGHVWVVLAVSVAVPFSERRWALPVMFRLYQTVKGTQKRGTDYRKKTELARDMVELVTSWAPSAKFRVLADIGYANATVVKGSPSNITYIGAMKGDAALTAKPGPRVKGTKGRPRVRGERLPNPRQLAEDEEQRWKKVSVFIYGRRTIIQYKELVGQWYRVAGGQLLRVVVVKTNTGKIPYRVFFSTNSKMSTTRILETYARRWGLEVCFRDLKQEFGFDDQQVRKREAVERLSPFIGCCYSLLVLWFAELGDDERREALTLRPWYRTKRGYSFADILNAARIALGRPRVFDLLGEFAQSGKIAKPYAKRLARRIRQGI